MQRSSWKLSSVSLLQHRCIQVQKGWYQCTNIFSNERMHLWTYGILASYSVVVSHGWPGLESRPSEFFASGHLSSPEDEMLSVLPGNHAVTVSFEEKAPSNSQINCNLTRTISGSFSAVASIGSSPVPPSVGCTSKLPGFVHFAVWLLWFGPGCCHVLLCF